MLKWIVLVGGLLLAGPARAGNTVLVGNFQPQGVDKAMAATIAELLAGELANRTFRSVSTEAQALATVKVGATAQALGAQLDLEHLAVQFQSDFLVTGSVGRVGRIFVLSLDTAGLSAHARTLLNARRHHWALVAEAEPESLIVAAQKGAEAVAASLASPEDEKQAAAAAAKQRAEEEAQEKSAAKAPARRSAAPNDPLSDDAEEAPQGGLAGIAGSSGSGETGSAAPPREPAVDLAAAARAAHVELLTSDPTHLEAQPQWHALAGQEMNPAEQFRLLVDLKIKVMRGQ